MRPSRYSYDLIKKSGDFVLNIPSADMLDAVKFAGANSGRDCDKFEQLGLTPIQSETISSPMIKECPINLECRLIQTMDLRSSHHLLLAEIITAHLDEDVLDEEKSKLDPNKMKLLSYFPMVNEYWVLGEKIQS